MKKVFLFFIFLIFIQNLFAISFKPNRNLIQIDLTYAAERGFERDEYLFSTEYNADWETVRAYTGLQNYSKVFDFTIGADWYPNILKFEFSKISLALGIEGIYHFQKQREIASEQDVVVNSYFKIFTKNGFSFRYLIGYSRKFTNVYALPKSAGFLKDHNIMMGLLFDKQFSNNFEIHYYLANFNMYRYYILDSTIHNFGCSKIFQKNIKFGGDIEVKFADQFVTTPYLSGLWFKVTVGYLFR